MRFDLVDHIRATTQDFSLPTVLWADFKQSYYNYLSNARKWKSFKFYSDGAVSQRINKISNARGGIYLFIVDPSIVPNGQRFLFYVGKATLTPNTNLRTRVKAYKSICLDPENSNRAGISMMFHYWRDYIYCQYIEVPDDLSIDGSRGNELIGLLEKEIYGKLNLPINVSLDGVEHGPEIRAAGL
jgi:hypothetical protein